ncbi:MAG: Gmad2 immunoglobulin-like domain-containing protein, partial [Acidimicrobiia bacterium]|nr:Gmad2 immunoglobulin-like domain-containing protein [Acidimicrobiia bacterium]
GAGEDPVEVAVGERVDLISVRMIGERQVVLALVDDTMVAFFADTSRSDLPLGRFDVGGTIEEVAIDGTSLAMIVNRDGMRSLETAALVGVDQPTSTAITAVAEGDPDAPLDVALAGNRLVVGTTDTVNTYVLSPQPDGTTPGPNFPLPASPVETAWWSFDASGDQNEAALIIGFGESALTIDLDNGARAVVPGIADPVRAAHWAFAPTSDGTPTDPVDVAAGDRYRVAAAAVAADTADPFLNMRSGAGADQPLVAKLPPTYRGLRATGNQAPTDDGATWLEFELLHPVRFTGELADNGTNANPTGWVNAALTVALPDGIGVGLDEVPGCVNGDSGTIGGELSGPAYVYGLESRFLSDDCLRVVITLAAGATSYSWSDIPAGSGPAPALPRITTPSSGADGTTIDLGRTATAWPRATETDDEVYVVRGEGGNLQLVAPMPVDRVDITPLVGQGVVVVDLTVAGPAPTADRFVALTREPLVGAGSVSMVGIARPFEATLGVSLVDAGGEPVTAVFSGNPFFGTMESDQYAVQTNDWTEAWGRFAVKVDGLDPGQYTLLLDGQGGLDNPSPTRVSFTITEPPVAVPALPDETGTLAARALVAFAQGGSFGDLPLAETVTLSLGLDEQMSRSRTELVDRDAWTFDAGEGFGGFSGPFNLLDTLDGPGGRQVEYSAGPIPFCAAPPKVWPVEWQALDQVNIEPVGIDSCIAWYGISLFLNSDGDIEVIVLDLFGP